MEEALTRGAFVFRRVAEKVKKHGPGRRSGRCRRSANKTDPLRGSSSWFADNRSKWPCGTAHPPPTLSLSLSLSLSPFAAARRAVYRVQISATQTRLQHAPYVFRKLHLHTHVSALVYVHASARAVGAPARWARPRRSGGARHSRGAEGAGPAGAEPPLFLPPGAHVNPTCAVCTCVRWSALESAFVHIPVLIPVLE